MRGSDGQTGALFSYVDLEARVRTDHPLGVIRAVVNEVLGAMQGDFSALYAGIRRPSTAREAATIEADLWDRDHIDLCGPASLVIRANGDVEIAFGTLQAGLVVDYGPDEIGFTWAGLDEMDEVSGTGSAELREDSSLQIEFEYHLGDEALLKASASLPQQPANTNRH